MTRIVSTFLLLVVALGAGTELAWAETMHQVNVEMNGTDVPSTPEVAEVEASDEVVFSTRTRFVVGAPAAMYAIHVRSESLSDGPLTRPPRH